MQTSLFINSYLDVAQSNLHRIRDPQFYAYYEDYRERVLSMCNRCSNGSN